MSAIIICETYAGV